jgi:cysteine desulfurase/selenocysteine lyase
MTAFRADFPAFGAGAGHFLDSAASSQKPASVIAAMTDFMVNSYANVHRGAYRRSVAATEAYEAARETVARFIGSPTPQQVIFTRGTTTSMNTVANGWGLEHLRPGDRILLTVMEHHSNLVPWQMVAKRTGAELDFAPIDDDYRLDLDAFGRLLEREPRIVAVSAMSNVLGAIVPLAEVSAMAHRVGAIVVADAAQLISHSEVEVGELGIDFLAFSGHKMLGPTGIGILWGASARLEEMEPFEGGGEMIADVQLDHSTWATIPHRFEAGTPPITESVGLQAAVEYLEKIGMGEVVAHDRELTTYCLERLAEVPQLKVQGPATTVDRGGVISFTLGDIHPHDLATILDEDGVSVRAGHHCAKPLMRTLGVPATARASFHVYNDREDVDALIASLHRAGELFGVA